MIKGAIGKQEVAMSGSAINGQVGAVGNPKKMKGQVTPTTTSADTWSSALSMKAKVSLKGQC